MSLASIVLPESVTSIGNYAFYNCFTLKEITITNPACEIYDSSNTIINYLGYTGMIYGEEDSTAQAYAEKYERDFAVIGTKAIGTYEDLTYHIFSDHIKITGCDISATTVTIPNEIEGLPVTVIGETAFDGCYKLKSLTLPETLTSIEKEAFYYCSGLTEIVIPESVTSIGASAFYYCSGLTKIVIPESVISIGKSAFSSCTNLLEITIANADCEIYDSSDTLTSNARVIYGLADSTAQAYAEKYERNFAIIGTKMFDTYENLTYRIYSDYIEIVECNSAATEVEIPSELEGLPVTIIGEKAFYGRTKIKSIVIPESVTSIGRLAFYNCSGLTKIVVPESVTSIDREAFGSYSGLKELTITNPACEIYDASYTITKDYNEKYDGVIYGLADSTAQAYAEKYELQFAVIGTKVYGEYESFSYRIYGDYIKITGFDGSVTEVTIPSEIDGIPVTIIGSKVFSGCYDLTSVTIPEGITTIGASAFYECNGLTSLILPESLTSIEKFAFYSCYGFTKMIIPENVTSIGISAFYYCSNLEEITISNPDCEIGDSSNTIPSGSVIIFGLENSTAQAYAENYNRDFAIIGTTEKGTYEKLEYRKYSDYVRIIGCDKSVTEVIIPSEIDGLPVTVIGANAFEECSDLTSVTLPECLTSIESYAFHSCSSLKSIIVPENVTSIGNRAFYYCSKLEDITISNAACEIYDSWNTIYTASNIPLIIFGLEDSTTQAYAEKHGYDFAIIGTKVRGTYENITYRIYSDHIKITGCDTSATSVRIPSEFEGLPVTAIGDNAFLNCSSLTEIIIPDSIKTIGRSAFENCNGLTSIIIPDDVESIGEYAFYNCTSLEDITITNAACEIYDYSSTISNESTIIFGLENSTAQAYAEKYDRDFAIIGTKVKGTYENLSYRIYSDHIKITGCDKSATEVVIPDELDGLPVTMIADRVFYECYNLTSVVLPEGLTSIGNYAFYYCYNLTSIVLPDGLTSIGNSAFYYCYNLTSIVLPEGLTSINNYTFYYCSGLTEVIIPESVTNMLN